MNGSPHPLVSHHDRITFIFLTVSTGVRAGVCGLHSTRPILSSTPPLSTVDPHTTTPDSIIRSPYLWIIYSVPCNFQPIIESLSTVGNLKQKPLYTTWRLVSLSLVGLQKRQIKIDNVLNGQMEFISFESSSKRMNKLSEHCLIHAKRWNFNRGEGAKAEVK